MFTRREVLASTMGASAVGCSDPTYCEVGTTYDGGTVYARCEPFACTAYADGTCDIVLPSGELTHSHDVCKGEIERIYRRNKESFVFVDVMDGEPPQRSAEFVLPLGPYVVAAGPQTAYARGDVSCMRQGAPYVGIRLAEIDVFTGREKRQVF